MAACSALACLLPTLQPTAALAQTMLALLPRGTASAAGAVLGSLAAGAAGMNLCLEIGASLALVSALAAYVAEPAALQPALSTGRQRQRRRGLAAGAVPLALAVLTTHGSALAAQAAAALHALSATAAGQAALLAAGGAAPQAAALRSGTHSPALAEDALGVLGRLPASGTLPALMALLEPPVLQHLCSAPLAGAAGWLYICGSVGACIH